MIAMALAILDPPSDARPTVRSRRGRPLPARIALLDIRKPRGDVFLDELEALLRSAGRRGAAHRQADLHEARAGRRAPRDRRRCDAVIEALAD